MPTPPGAAMHRAVVVVHSRDHEPEAEKLGMVGRCAGVGRHVTVVRQDVVTDTPDGPEPVDGIAHAHRDGVGFETVAVGEDEYRVRGVGIGGGDGRECDRRRTVGLEARERHLLGEEVLESPAGRADAVGARLPGGGRHRSFGGGPVDRDPFRGLVVPGDQNSELLAQLPSRDPNLRVAAVRRCLGEHEVRRRGSLAVVRAASAQQDEDRDTGRAQDASPACPAAARSPTRTFRRRRGLRGPCSGNGTRRES